MTNQTLVQYFHWYFNEEQKLWQKVTAEAEHLAEFGITMVWLPPAYKATSGEEGVGYDAYDLYDLGEFDQKNSIGTRYGTKDEYMSAIKALQEKGLAVIADIVFNHKAGGDQLERVKVKRVDPANRHEFISDEFEIDAWTKFTFPGRNGKYSEFVWDHQCFSGIDWAEDLQESAIFAIQNQYGEGWTEVPSNEMGNYDYLMFNDVDFRNNAVREELKRWGEWYFKTCNINGFRLDAVKHIAPWFLNEWIDHMRSVFQEDCFIMAENWVIDDVNNLTQYIDDTEGRTQLFDSLLHINFYNAGNERENYDLSKIFENTLVDLHPHLAVTFVDNHDSQPLQSLESYVDYWFRPLGYAIILLREQGIPCLFYPDMYGAKYSDFDTEGNEAEVELVYVPELPALTHLRRDRAYGLQRDYLDHPNCIGWTREGEADKEHVGLAVVMSNSEEGFKRMEVGVAHSGETFIDALGKRSEEIMIDEQGYGDFLCNGGSVSVWIRKD